VLSLEVLRLEDGRWTILDTHAGTDVVRADPFAEIELELPALWADSPRGSATATPASARGPSRW